MHAFIEKRFIVFLSLSRDFNTELLSIKTIFSSFEKFQGFPLVEKIRVRSPDDCPEGTILIQ